MDKIELINGELVKVKEFVNENGDLDYKKEVIKKIDFNKNSGSEYEKLCVAKALNNFQDLQTKEDFECFLNNMKNNKKWYIMYFIDEFKQNNISSFLGIIAITICFGLCAAILCGVKIPLSLTILCNICLISHFNIIPPIYSYIKFHKSIAWTQQNIINLSSQNESITKTEKKGEELDAFIEKIRNDLIRIKENPYPNAKEDALRFQKLAYEYLSSVTFSDESDFDKRLADLEDEVNCKMNIYSVMQENMQMQAINEQVEAIAELAINNDGPVRSLEK